MLELRRVVFFVDIGDNLLEKAKASQECREECKNLFISLGFQVDTFRQTPEGRPGTQ